MGLQERKRLKRIREQVINRDGFICSYCKANLTLDTLTMDHIVPESKRGTYNATNLIVACSSCNNKRGNKPFFEFCKQYDLSEKQLLKYKNMYFNNLKIKILNIAKEECLDDNEAVPNELIKRACEILKIRTVDFSPYENKYLFEIKFGEVSNRKKIKYCFELLIRIIESEC